MPTRPPTPAPTILPTVSPTELPSANPTAAPGWLQTSVPTSGGHSLVQGIMCSSFPSASNVQTFYSDSDEPVLPYNNDDNTPLVVGARISTSVGGSLTAFRYYKSADEGPTHRIKIFKASTGELLRGMVVSDTCEGPGWVSIPLTQPLRVWANEIYVIALTNVFNYPKTEHFFPATGGLTRGSLTQLGSVYGFDRSSMPLYSSPKNPSYFVDGKRLTQMR